MGELASFLWVEAMLSMQEWALGETNSLLIDDNNTGKLENIVTGKEKTVVLMIISCNALCL